MIPFDIEAVKKREAYIAMEFYRVAKDALGRSTFPDTRSLLDAVLPEVPLDDQRVDLVILGKAYDRRMVLLVVECKQRPLTTFGRSYANATRQAWHYADKLDSKFFAVFDGWLVFIFRRFHPYLVGVYNAELEKELTDSMIADLFVGLMEYEYRNKSERLSRLPKPRDPELLKRRILPSIARSVVRRTLQDARERELDEKAIETRAHELLEHWTANL